MLTRWFLNTLLIIFGILVLLFGGYWWWSIQPDDIELSGVETREVTLDNGLQLTLIADPDAPAARLDWTWEQGVAHEPAQAPGIQELTTHVLLYGDTPTGVRHLRTRAQRDPDGRVVVRTDRYHTAVHYETSAPVFDQEVRHFGQLLANPAWPLDGIAVERSRLAHYQGGLERLTATEWMALSAELGVQTGDSADVEPIWPGLNNTGVARELTRYAAERLVPGRMAVSLRAPESLNALEALGRDAFSELSGESGDNSTGSVKWQWGDGRLIRLPVTELRHSVDPEDAVPELRFLYPWRLEAADRDDADRLVQWLNTPYEQSPARRLVSDGLANELRAYRTDDALVVNLYGSELTNDDLAVIGATLNRFLAQVTLPVEPTSNELARADGVEIATDLRLSPRLLPDLGAVTILHHAGAEDAEPRIEPLPELTPDRALALGLPLDNRDPVTVEADLEPNDYELLGWQPQQLVADDRLTLWHYQDNRFGSQLVSAHVRLHWPVGYDRREQARWQRWAETQGPGWSEETLWAGQLAQTPAVGHSVTADEQGMVWQFTARWPDVETWLYQLFQAFPDARIERSAPRPETRADVRLMRDRADIAPPPVPERLDTLPVTVLLMGRVDANSARQFADWWQDERPDAVAEQPDPPADPFRLAAEHQVIELRPEDDRSVVTRFIQLPQHTLRTETLAAWTLPWVQERLTAAVRSEAFAGELAISMESPLGYPGLRLQLSSNEQDPGRLGLYGQAFWRQLESAVPELESERFDSSSRWRANLLRESAQSMPTLANYHWNDITAGRRHFNGRTLRAQVLEGTSSDGWAFFVNEWLFDTAARQMTVFEIGERWQEDYQEARTMPPGAVPWQE